MIKTVKIVVEFRDGKVYATGPLEQKEFCLALLEEAKNIVNSYKKTTITIPSKEEIKKLNGNNV